MKLPAMLCAVLLVVSSSVAASIHGTVRAKGKEGVPDNPAAGGSYASRKFKFVERMDYNDLRDFVVYLKGPIARTAPPKEPVVIRQKDATFIPHVLPIMVGTKVEWPNEDEIFHNVFSKSDVKPFDLGLYKKGDPPKTITFDKPGKVDVFCSIHAKMSCTILVLENPCFAVTDGGGRYTISNVPAGTYELVAWNERLPDKAMAITIKDDDDLKVDITMGIENLPTY